MNKYFYVLFILVAAVIIGFVAGAFLNSGITACTEMSCLCEKDGEISCNSCSSEDMLFAWGVVNVAKVCSAKEILICKSNEYVSRRYDETGECRTEVKWFDFVLHYVE
ncbi:hypothetical protein A3K73_06445 [Candidatus Pacearchaeota archaeon RBG_13_36_9]|nr:MAG: hypothetical protein A3K73_06445 [Candidatus Pacearchaeota archaeon RBG_13_36_9]